MGMVQYVHYHAGVCVVAGVCVDAGGIARRVNRRAPGSLEPLQRHR
jgi:hypothetical protein